jgi:hypothetical protein
VGQVAIWGVDTLILSADVIAAVTGGGALLTAAGGLIRGSGALLRTLERAGARRLLG